MISSATSNALAQIAARVRDLVEAYTPGSEPVFHDLAGGIERRSADPLAVASPPGTYFIVQDEGGRRTFTRDGDFHFESESLVDRAKRPVLGFRGGDSTATPLQADLFDVRLGRAGDMRIEPDGSVAYSRSFIDPRNGERRSERVCIGRLALARFAAGTRLAPLDSTRSLAPAGVTPHVGRAGDGNFGLLSTQTHAAAGIDFDAGILKLQEAYMALEALRSVQSAQGGLDKAALGLVK